MGLFQFMQLNSSVAFIYLFIHAFYKADLR